MAGKEDVTEVKLQFLDRVLLKKRTMKFLLALRYGEKTFSELRSLGVKPPDRFSFILHLVHKERDDNGIMKYTLTSRGRRLSDATVELLKVTDEILPSED